MILIDEKMIIGTDDHLTHKVYEIALDKSYKELRMSFKYSPKFVTEDIADGLKDYTIDHYFPEEFKTDEIIKFMRDYMTIVNVIQLSIIHDDKFVGCWNCNETEQNSIISKDGSTLGFIDHDITPGKYTFTLSVTGAFEDIDTSLFVEAIDE